MKIGEKIKKLRLKKGFTQENIHTQSTVAAIEKGNMIPSEPMLYIRWFKIGILHRKAICFKGYQYYGVMESWNDGIKKILDNIRITS